MYSLCYRLLLLYSFRQTGLLLLNCFVRYSSYNCKEQYHHPPQPVLIPILRHRKYPTSEEAKDAMEAAIKEQLAEGFLSAAPP